MGSRSGLIIAESHQGLSQRNHSVNTSLGEDMPVAFNISQVLKYGFNGDRIGNASVRVKCMKFDVLYKNTF